MRKKEVEDKDLTSIERKLLEIQKEKYIQRPLRKHRHDWRFLERWIGDRACDTDYIFYCRKCLKITSIKIVLKKRISTKHKRK